jgi:hypothetical protein
MSRNIQWAKEFFTFPLMLMLRVDLIWDWFEYSNAESIVLNDERATVYWAGIKNGGR